jgi:hypothetical protein
VILAGGGLSAGVFRDDEICCGSPDWSDIEDKESLRDRLAMLETWYICHVWISEDIPRWQESGASRTLIVPSWRSDKK